jgi:hypothetical protein
MNERNERMNGTVPFGDRSIHPIIICSVPFWDCPLLINILIFLHKLSLLFLNSKERV